MRASLMSAAFLGSLAWASETLPPRLYEVTTETVMPHLEESLRYATTRQQHCLARQELFFAFPVLEHPALKDCRLQAGSRGEQLVSYVLLCENGTGTTGQATWHVGEHRLRGTLNVKLGGKNMTFYQRVTARNLGPCERAEFESKTRSAVSMEGR